MIVFNQVSKQFFNDSFGLQDISFAVEPGELVLVTGPTGSGKTTMMRLITKEYTPTSGKVYFDKVCLDDISAKEIPLHRRLIGVIFQDYRLLPEANVWENVALPLLIAKTEPEKIEERVTDLLELVGLEEKAELFPRELSGGEAQRVGIARALATAPPVIFADEPTGNLDPETSINILKLLKKINQLGTTVFLATHDVVVLKELDNLARRIELKDGRLISDSDPKKIPDDLEEVSTSEVKVEIETLDDEKEPKEIKKPAKKDKKPKKKQPESNQEDEK